jgi:predicted O-methyltransferase YrrM
VEEHLQHALDRLRLWRDLGRVHPLPARLAPDDESLGELVRELEPLHERYVTQVSNRYWAASLQLSAFLWHLCRTIEARTVLELGSGFTTYVFRRYAAESGHDVRVLSADDDDAWLEKTLTFLDSNGAARGELVPLDHLKRTIKEAQFDLVFNDVYGKLRPAATAWAAEHMTPTGLLILDDANRAVDRRSLLTVAKEHRLAVYDLRPWTHDEIGRWALLSTNRPENRGARNLRAIEATEG